MGGAKRIVFAAIAVLLVIGALWFTNRAVTPKKATWEDIVAEAKAGGYSLINTDELRERYAANPAALLLVDTRQEWEYDAGAIKGAVNFPMEPTWWSRWRKKDQLERFLGPDKDRFIVFY